MHNKLKRFDKYSRLVRRIKKSQGIVKDIVYKAKGEKQMHQPNIIIEGTPLWTDTNIDPTQQSALINIYHKLSYNPFYNWSKDKTNITMMQDLADMKDPNILNISCLGKSDEYHNSVVSAIEQIGQNRYLSAGYDGLLKIWQLDKDLIRHSLQTIKSIYLQNFPIQCLKPLSQNQIVVCGNRKYLQVFDLQKLKGQKLISALLTKDLQQARKTLASNSKYFAVANKNIIIILENKSKQIIQRYSCPQKVLSIVFSNRSSILATTNSGNIYQFSLQTGTIQNKMEDQGSISTNSIAFSNSSLIMTGTNTGNVNLYNGITKTLIKEFDNLTTGVEKVVFNACKQQAVFSSPWKTNNIRIVNLQSLKVYSNWPNNQTRLKYIRSINYSRKGDALLIGNDAGRIFVYSIQ